MSLFDCLQSAMDDPETGASKERGKAAQAMWREKADMYEDYGHPRHTAEQLAADDVKEAFRRDYGEKRHVYLAVASFQRKAQAHVAEAKAPDMVERMKRMYSGHKGFVRYANGRLREYLDRHAPRVQDLVKGKPRNPAEQAQILDELHGTASGNPIAKGIADSIRDTLEDLRLSFNEAGGLINKLDAWGLPHIHDVSAVMRVGKEGWIDTIMGRLDWERTLDPLTGRAFMDDAGKRSYLREAWDNIVFGKEADDPVYGRPKGVATYRKHMDARHLHFKSGKDWGDYNVEFGTGGLHQSLMGHVHRMARDIVLMREFGPNPRLGAEYEADLWRQRTKKEGDVEGLGKMANDADVALRMLNVMSGGNTASSPALQWSSTFFSTARTLMTAAFLDRAVIASLTDLNSMRMAAKAVGMNEWNIMSKQVGLMKTLSPDELRRAGWVADTMADAGTALARFQAEVAPREWAERVTQVSMRIQGLNFWTDRARATAHFEFSGFMASQMDRPLKDISPELASMLKKWNVTPEDWDLFRQPENVFTADNGATFLSPIHFRNATKLDASKADRLFFKMQGAVEDFMALAVTTDDLVVRAWTDPAASSLAPGHPLYELAKSATMFKSFPLTFTINQHRMIMSKGGYASRDGLSYGINLAAGATLLGAVSLQINDLMMGRDPQDMTSPMFWVRSAAKGGGFAILGDIVSTGQASWGGGFQSYVAGPVPQMATDVWGVTVGPAMTALWQAATGEEVDVNYAKRLAKFGKRYTPMGQTPVVGPAIDRLFWDQLQLLLDPESVDDMAKASKARENLYGGGEYWLPGQALPDRGPNLGVAIGQ